MLTKLLNDGRPSSLLLALHLASPFISIALLILPSCHLTVSLISYSTPESYAAQLLTARQGKMQEARSRSIEHLSGLGRTFCGVRNPAASFLTSTFQTFVTIHLLSFSFRLDLLHLLLLLLLCLICFVFPHSSMPRRPCRSQLVK
jgi:hypothetical protein